MAHFAKVLNGVVVNVIVADHEFFDTFIDDSPGTWIQTSYNTYGNKHLDQDGNPDNGVALRGNYAGIGFVYDHQQDVFYAPQPYPSWTLNQSTWLWESPVPYPTDGSFYRWDEESQTWMPAA